MDKTIYEKITSKKELSQLPKKDVEKAFSHFENRQTSNEEKIRLTRELLHKVFGVFTSTKLLSPKEKPVEWILRKHVSTRERLPYYTEIYKRIFGDFKKEINIFDLGAGINGFSYGYLPKKSKYIAIEAIGQLVKLMNNFFKKNKFSARAIHESLFELEKIKEIIKKEKGKKIVFLFKVLDSLEMLERDYSKKLLEEVVPLVDKVAVSFATRSLVARKKFKANRNWIKSFIQDNFNVLDEFELEGEKYIVFN